MVSQAEEYLTPEEVAKRKRVHISTVYRWINDGVPIGGVVVHLKSIRVGGRQTRISQEALDQFDNECNPEEWRQIALRQERERREAKKDGKRLRERLAEK